MSSFFRSYVDPQALVARACQLIATPTMNPPGDEAALANLLADELQALGMETTVVPLAKNRASVVGRLRGRGDRPALVLSGHLDTVPPGEEGWTRDPFTPEVSDGRLFGLGSADMKGAVAAMVEAAAAIRRSGLQLGGDLLLAFSASEEIDSAGAASLVAAGALEGAGGVIIGEPTGNGVFVAEKGVAWIEVVTRGTTAHGSMPERGVNAIYHMASVLAELERFRFDRPPHPLLGHPTINVGTLAGGVAPNVVADRCVAMVDMRLVPGQEPEQALGAIRRILDDLGRERRHFDAEARLVMGRAAVETDPAHPLVRMVLDAASAVTGRRLEAGGVTYATDASAYVLALGVPMAICGPGQAVMAHQPDEYVEVDLLNQAAAIYAECARAWLGAGQRER